MEEPEEVEGDEDEEEDEEEAEEELEDDEELLLARFLARLAGGFAAFSSRTPPEVNRKMFPSPSS
jgi:hypothetical protein